MHISDGRAAAATVALGQLVMAEAVLRPAVEVVGARMTRLDGCLDEGLHHHVARSALRHRQVLQRALEARQQVVVAPAGAARVAPAVVVGRIAADVDHRVRRRRAAQRAPARQDDAPPVAMRLAARGVVPVDLAAAERGDPQRDVDVVVGVRRTGLDQQDADVGILAQARRQHAPCRAGADDDVVVHGAHPFTIAMTPSTPRAVMGT